MPNEPVSMPVAEGGVVASLQRAAALHMTAVEHYQTLAAHFGRWGYAKLSARYAEDAQEERDHLTAVLQRLEYYDAQPTYAHDQPSWPRHDFEGILASNYELETEAANAEKAGVSACRKVGDEMSAIVFVSLLAGSEASIAEIEATQKIIEQIGLDNYLANQV